MNQDYIKKVLEAAAYIRHKFQDLIEIGFMTGTGLGESTGSINISIEMDYHEIPGFPISTVESHRGRLLLGTLSGKPIAAMMGRFHLYEGYTPLEVTFPVRVMRELGVKTLIISNASGGINPDYAEGDIMIVCDHINLTGQNPLTGPNHDGWGERFPDMTRVWEPSLIKLVENSAARLRIPVRKGVYAGLHGPSLETPAEIRFLRAGGADAVGFSTVMEAIAGVHAGMRLLGLAVITNINDPDNPQPASVAAIIRRAGQSARDISNLIKEIAPRINLA